MLNLIVHAKYQYLLSQFLASILPTIDDNVKIYAVTEGLLLPQTKRIIRYDRTEFRPGKYFNLILNELRGQDGYIGIINDDILFHKDWYPDVMALLKDHPIVSPGFIETLDYDYFLKRVEMTKDLTGVEQGMHDAFFCFPISLAEKIGGFNEDAVWWWDMSFYLSAHHANYSFVTSQRVTIQHYVRGTYNPKEIPPSKELYQQIWDKWGMNSHKIYKANSINIRGKFNV
jgi:hypothetical protein